MDNRDFNLYKIFLTLYELKSISKTANKLYVSQPAISYSLKELESQLGYSLFYRNSKGIEPTIEAMELYSYISTAFNIIKSGEEHVTNLNSLNIGTIRIGAHSYIASYYLCDFICEFRKLYPGVKFEVICKSTTDLIDLLDTRKIDLVIGQLPISINNKAACKKMLTTFNSCFVYNKKLLHNYKIETPEDLTKYPLILPNAKSSFRIKLDETFERRNLKLNSIVEAWTVEFMLEMIKKGAGIGFCAKNVVDSINDDDTFETVTFDNILPTMDICAVYLNDFERPVLTKFVEFLSEKGNN